MSSVSTTPQLGIAWSLEILTSPDSDGNQQQVTAYSNSWQPEGLEIQFEMNYTNKSAFWYADISIYNLNEATEQLVLKQGMIVTLKAGFQNQPYGVIFQGALFQPLWEREDMTDFKLTLHCIVGVSELSNNFASSAYGPGLSQRDIVTRMAADARTPFTIQTSDGLTKKSYPRGQVIFGSPGKVLEEMALDNAYSTWFDGVRAYVADLSQATSVPTYTFGPGKGLVGTPQVTQDGVNMTVLLDPRIEIGEQIMLDQSAIRQQPRVQGSYPTILDHDGIYIVLGIAHRGDSRGNVWFSDLTCGTSVGGKLSLQV
jgi:hypothetical protein